MASSSGTHNKSIYYIERQEDDKKKNYHLTEFTYNTIQQFDISDPGQGWSPANKINRILLYKSITNLYVVFHHTDKAFQIQINKQVKR